MGCLWEHRLSTEDKKELTKAFGEYCRQGEEHDYERLVFEM
jgi:hypothetical protein